MKTAIKAVWSGLLDLVYPPLCLVCGADTGGGALCEACIDAFKPILPPFCDRCGEPVTARRIVCTRCEEGPLPAYDWSQAAYQYDGAMLRAVQRLKYDRKPALAPPLGSLLASSLDVKSHLADPDRDPALPMFDLLIPVPLHPSRQRVRGFNQAEKLAIEVARRWDLKLDGRSVRRVRRTATQTARTHEERAANVRGAFRVVDPGAIDTRSVLIVDDVLTSTSTARELARTLSQAGAARVCVLALARSV